MGRTITYIMENKTCLKPPTSHNTYHYDMWLQFHGRMEHQKGLLSWNKGWYLTTYMTKRYQIPSSPAKNDTGICLKLWHTLNNFSYTINALPKNIQKLAVIRSSWYSTPKTIIFVEILPIFGAVNEDAQGMVPEGTRVKCTSDWWCHLSMDWWWQHEGTPQAIWCILWWTNIAMEHHHAINGKIHYFYCHFPLLFVSSPEGN